MRFLGICLWIVAGPLLAQNDSQAVFGSAEQRELSSFLRKYCYDCHGGGEESGGLKNIDLIEALSKSTVIGESLEESSLWERVGVDKDMPPPADTDLIPRDSERQIVRQWLEAGAPSGTSDAKRQAITQPEVFRLVLADLESIRHLGRQQFTRYISLVNLYNATLENGKYDVSDKLMAAYRQGVSKFINSLSWRYKIVPPTVVEGSKGTLLRIDLGDYMKIQLRYQHSPSYQHHLGTTVLSSVTW